MSKTYDIDATKLEQLLGATVSEGQVEAVNFALTAQAAGLPTYSELVEALREVRNAERYFDGVTSNVRLHGKVRENSVEAARRRRVEARVAADDLLARIPA